MKEKKSASILKKFLLFNFFVFLVLGILTTPFSITAWVSEILFILIASGESSRSFYYNLFRSSPAKFS